MCNDVNFSLRMPTDDEQCAQMQDDSLPVRCTSVPIHGHQRIQGRTCGHASVYGKEDAGSRTADVAVLQQPDARLGCVCKSKEHEDGQQAVHPVA